MEHLSTQEKRRKPLLRVMDGEKLWPPPVWLMRQAGRFLPEFRAIREKADFLTRCTTTDIVIELTLQPVRRFAMDAAILFSDILILPWTLGQKVAFVPGRGPQLSPCRQMHDLEQLRKEQQEDIYQPILRAITELSKILRSSYTALLGFAGSPFTVACYMVEGGTSKNFEFIRRAAYQNPDFLDRLIDLLTEETKIWLSRQIEAGVEGIMLFDSWASLLPPNLFEKYVIKPTHAITNFIKGRYPNIRIIGFPRLCGTLLKKYGEDAGIDVVSCDTTVDLKVADTLLPHGQAFQGNLDPYGLVYGGPLMEEEVKHICKQGKSRPHIFNLGHGVLPQTPVSHVSRLVELVRSL